MADIKAHYDQFLAAVYPWMTGDFQASVTAEETYFSKSLKPSRPGAKALDMGAGHGIHSVALAKLGYQVEAVDFSAPLVEEIKRNKGTLSIKPVLKDMRTYRPLQPVDALVCMGDSLAHLGSQEELATFAAHLHSIVKAGGQLVLSFRDFSADLKGTSRAVLVRSDESRIVDCFMQFGVSTIDVTDMLHEKTQNGWSLKTSSYKKIRLTSDSVTKTFKENGFSLTSQEATDGVIRLAFRA